MADDVDPPDDGSEGEEDWLDALDDIIEDFVEDVVEGDYG